LDWIVRKLWIKVTLPALIAEVEMDSGIAEGV
jgi:hypothetical protein